MAWKIEFDPLADREIDRLDPEIARRIVKFLHGRLAKLDDPRSIGAALTGPRFGEFWKYRVGDFRVIARIEDKILLILVVKVGNRSVVYR